MQKRCILIWDVHQAYLSKFGYHKTGDGGGGVSMGKGAESFCQEYSLSLVNKAVQHLTFETCSARI